MQTMAAIFSMRSGTCYDNHIIYETPLAPSQGQALTVVLLAQLATILPCDADRMAAFFREPGVVEDPGLDGAVRRNAGQCDLAYFGQHGLIGPRRLAQKMQQRLVFRRGFSPPLTSAAMGSTLFRSPGNSRPVQ